ncbi:putative ABC transport system permease protein [Catalinimonas alkaloidigena]|uniref:ABC transporter permease n=1 Tax=Catalinimonas alkaloidigena TaxID=1075417 RepID=UPI002405A40D|nr:ABC transporter permease [Catalinimonas alkaloidigena]MDF9797414.1 putative ABC transport system permease protein [Catalinimonas alkaloidigena]
MFRNLIKVAIRNITKEKIYSLINILGLTIGISCSLFLVLYILDELSYDTFHEKKGRIYRVVTHFQEPDNAFSWPNAQIPLAQELEEKYSEVSRAVRFIRTGRELFVNPEKDRRFYEESFYYTDSSVFDVFTFDFISGNASTALVQPNALVLTASAAEKYFDDEDPIGQSLQNRDKTYEITGVIEDLPYNSHLEFDALISRTTLPNEIGSWGSWGVPTYVLLNKNADDKSFEVNFSEQIYTTHLRPIFEDFGVTMEYELQPLESIHLYSNLAGESGGGDISYIYIFASVAFFMILIASINYMNLATARAARRAKEVGIRKTSGSSRWQLIRQFLTESIVITVIALIISLVLIAILLPSFNYISGKEILFSYLLQPKVMLSLLAIILIVGAAGGSYPAFYLSGFEPAEVLKGQKSSGRSNAGLRKVLVVAQFAISITMVISTLVVYDQLQFIRSKDLGFDKEHVVSVKMPEEELRNNYEVLRNRLLDNPQVIDVASSNSKPGEGISKNIMNVETEKQGDEEKGIDVFFADYDFVNVLGFEIVDGRNFDRKFATDTAAALVNEAMVARMAWEKPLGKTFTLPNSSDSLPDPVYTVVGVVKDYHQQSFYNTIEPLAIFFRESNFQLHVKLKGDNLSAGIEALEENWAELNPGKPLQYSFLEEDFDEQYQADIKRGQIFTLFSALTVIIACLGLLGLAAYTTQQRDKEIGIRKVIGATVQHIILLIYKDFAILIGIAVIIAFPLAFFLMRDWLSDFAYQTDIKVFTFIVSVLLTALITILAVGFHTLKAATANPVKSLRDN